MALPTDEYSQVGFATRLSGGLGSVPGESRANRAFLPNAPDRFAMPRVAKSRGRDLLFQLRDWIVLSGGMTLHPAGGLILNERSGERQKCSLNDYATDRRRDNRSTGTPRTRGSKDNYGVNASG